MDLWLGLRAELMAELMQDTPQETQRRGEAVPVLLQAIALPNRSWLQGSLETSVDE